MCEIQKKHGSTGEWREVRSGWNREPRAGLGGCGEVSSQTSGTWTHSEHFHLDLKNCKQMNDMIRCVLVEDYSECTWTRRIKRRFRD